MKDNNFIALEEKKEINNANNDAILKTFITDSENINSKNEVISSLHNSL
jgi:hypothetical protein